MQKRFPEQLSGIATFLTWENSQEEVVFVDWVPSLVAIACPGNEIEQRKEETEK